MSFIPSSLIKNPTRILSLVSVRQEALSDNIANMHTEGYRRKDVDFSQYLNSGTASTLEAKMTDKYGASEISANFSGDNISTEDELALMQQNYIYYNMAVRQLSSTITQIKTALNVSSGS